MNKDIFLTNSYGGKKEKFQPIDKNDIKMYVCGPTVYDDPHIGNARPLVVFDILFKVLKCKYGKDNVTYVRNITDIDDKIIQSAKDKKITISELTNKININFQEDCKYLNCEEPSFQPKATENINEMIEMISGLMEKGFAYESKNHIYFEVKKFNDYGKLSNKKIEDLISGSRVEVSSNKKNAEDFVLWKPSSEDEPSWSSPWGNGRPGWHLECSVMSKKYLGDNFDIHGGGRDLIFPHHENEIAQSRCANETEVFSNYWVHNGFITLSNEKMAKSQGNILKISDFKKNVNGQALRLALISAQYRQPLDWNDKLLDESQKTIDKWYKSYIELEKPTLISDDDLYPLYDDLNTPKYIANLHKLYEKSQSGNTKDKKEFVSACNFVGLLTETKDEWDNFKKNKSDFSDELIEIKIKERNQARDDKNYELADKIRNELLEKGVQIEDKDGKTSWKFK
ncbi:cysteine--tRNA ligase [Pelagibacterales bacterium SAG-MED17]|nr:cysteine--tRNA ligase [Pelagibacterales bacterium SAG-MED17]